jgi:phosphoribosylaminoimidazole-succinocarboxamide synthase
MDTLYESALPSLPLRSRGKVRDLYDIDGEYYLIVTTDRLSAFDVVLPDPIPEKGRVLTHLSRFWFERLQGVIRNHLAPISLSEVLPDPRERALVATRAMVVRKLQPLPVEAVVRGYLIGSGWKDYQRTGMVCGIRLPEGLRLADRLPEPIFTPSTKAALGAHDENVSFDAIAAVIGGELAERIRTVSLRIYREAAEYALARGLIIADTKFEFGLDEQGQLVLMDEVLTPDSSRFWPADRYQPGVNPPSFDKQFVRDYLETLDWDKQPPGPELPAGIVARTAAKYREARERLTGSA